MPSRPQDEDVAAPAEAEGDVSDPLPWDLAFLGLGAVLLATGLALRRSVTSYRPR